MKYHLFGHNDKQFVKVGDIVKSYETKIATIGTGNGQFYAHLHHSIAEDLSVESQLKYVIGWAKSQVQQYYRDPLAEGVDYVKMFGTKVDIGNAGYSWLQPLLAPQKGFHPGIDINGLGGGNTDIGMAFTSPIDGKVVHSYDGTGKNGGWGKLLIIEEITQDSMKIPSKLQDEIKKYQDILKGQKEYEKEVKYKFKDELREDDLLIIKELQSGVRNMLEDEKKSKKNFIEMNVILEEKISILEGQLSACLSAPVPEDPAVVELEHQLFSRETFIEDLQKSFDVQRVTMQNEIVRLNNLVTQNAADSGILDALQFLLQTILTRKSSQNPKDEKLDK